MGSLSLFIGFSRYALPVLAFIILIKCMMTLLFGHPVNKTYGYLMERSGKEKIPLNTWETSIGRGKSCDIMLNEETVSRFHAVISRRPDGWYIYDTMSKAGITVNGTKVDKKANIKHGDRLVFGSKTYIFVVANDPVIQLKEKKKGKNTAPPSTAAAQEQSVPTQVPKEPVWRNQEDLNDFATPEGFHLDFQKSRSSYAGSFTMPDPTGQNVYSDAAGAKKTAALQLLPNGNIYELGGQEVLLGRSRGCDIVIDLLSVSRSHAKLTKTARGWCVEDLGSKAGTKVNGQDISAPVLLTVGDEIAVSDRTFRFFYRTGNLSG